jgi:hypothetical protein
MDPVSSFMRYNGPDAYIHERAARRIVRDGRIRDADGNSWEPDHDGVSYAVTASNEMRLIPWGSQVDWSPIRERLDAAGIFHFWWSAFSDHWRSYFVFASAEDGLEFVRVLRDMGARAWSPVTSDWE